MTGGHPGLSVSRETREALEDFAEQLAKWNRRINLVAPSQISMLWDRHILDSLQVLALAPQTATRWMDMGTGGGFPGLVCAIASREERPDLGFTLVESDHRKAIFLERMAVRFGAGATILKVRVEDVPDQTFDVISARALAPIEMLFDYAERFLNPDTVMLLPKGVKSESELTQADRHWHNVAERIPSRTDPKGVILRITRIGRRS